MSFVSELYQKLTENDLWDKTIHLKRQDYLCRSGTIETYVYYVVSGSFKIAILDDDNEHIIRFGYTNNFITALDSFISENPTDFYIQALKKAEVKVISKTKFLEFMTKNDAQKVFWEHILKQLFLQLIEREKDILIKSPYERYQRVLKRSPQLFQEIPHKYIAKYLRMSPETLSRLKKS